MIELIYDENSEVDKKDTNENTGDSGTGRKEEKYDREKLPRNIRQIGSPSLNKRIYIEDYVVTYLNYISRPGSTQARGAILLGECSHTDLGDIIFISGAVDAQNIEFDMDESEFTQEAWSEIYDKIKENFPELSVMGWFLSRMGFSTSINEKIEKMHVENFPGKDKLLYVTDSLENEDAFYMYEKGQLVKQKGYFIYYTKNENMQNYIIKQRGGVSEEENTEIRRKDEELIKTYRSKNAQAKSVEKPQGGNLVYVASSFLVIAVLAMGITVLSNSDKMKDMEVSINRLELTVDESEPDLTGEATDVMAAIENENSEQVSTEESSIEEAGTEQTANEDTETETQNTGELTTEQVLPTVTNGNPTYYLVRYGDTLSSISYYEYGSVKYADNIAAANNMNVEDKIYDGQTLLIPTID